MENKPTKENTYINNNLTFREVCATADQKKFEYFVWNGLVYKVVWSEFFENGPGGRHMNITVNELE